VTKILVVDDDRALRRALQVNLRARGYEVVLAEDGRSALAKASQELPDAIVLDLGLPDLDGAEVLDGLRGWTEVPVVVLSARGSQDDKVLALDAGADDYVTKPFGMDELLARLRASLRRATHPDEAPVVETEEFSVDLAAKEVRGADGKPIRLTPTEWNVLEVLARNEGKLVGQRELLQEVWGPAYETETNYLRVYVAQLRRKLERDPSHPRHLLTEPGMGYRFRGERG
jgi:two-component system KDP operon response regulator KdpE